TSDSFGVELPVLDIRAALRVFLATALQRLNLLRQKRQLTVHRSLRRPLLIRKISRNRTTLRQQDLQIIARLNRLSQRQDPRRLRSITRRHNTQRSLSNTHSKPPSETRKKR